MDPKAESALVVQIFPGITETNSTDLPGHLNLETKTKVGIEAKVGTEPHIREAHPVTGRIVNLPRIARNINIIPAHIPGRNFNCAHRPLEDI